jgi:protoheme IX farnesyltransferase
VTPLETTALARDRARSAAAVLPSLPSVLEALRSVAESAKPRVTTMVVFTTAIGLRLAPGSIGIARGLVLLGGTALLVASANMLNSWYERDTDALMIRTRTRPIPAGRMDPWVGLATGIGLGVFAIPILALAINPLTALLGLIAHLAYVLAYTPLKRITPWALEVGAIPGAIPPLMGWTAATGSLAWPGIFLFALMVFWQLPHFLAIAIYLEEDYRRGGLEVLSVSRGAATASRRLAIYTIVVVAVSLAAQPLRLAGLPYTIAASLLGAGFVLLASRGFRATVGGAWARKTMLYSILWLTALLVALVAGSR